jgi:predicted TIM-barrel enzyme
MKNKLKWFGIIALTVVFGLSLTGCFNWGNGNEDEDEDGDGETDGGTNNENPANLLEEGVWKAGSLSKDDQTIRYTISVIRGTIYFIRWNDSRQGDSTKTGDIRVTARHSNGDPLFTNVDAAWNNAQYFTAASDGTVTLTVSKGSDYYSTIGTYEIRYTTARPEDTVALVENTWKTGTLFISEQISEYTISVTGGTIYFIWWNDSRQGDSTKTGDIKVTARHSNGDPLFTNVDAAWNNAQYFTAASDGTVTLTVSKGSDYYSTIGTYEIRYTAARPEGTVALDVNTWKTGTLFISEQINEYTINVTGGTTYYIWWNDSRQGNGTKTGDIKVSARYGEGDPLFTNVDAAWNTAQSFTAASDGKVTLTVSKGSDYYSNIGTYGIKYTTTNNRQ